MPDKNVKRINLDSGVGWEEDLSIIRVFKASLESPMYSQGRKLRINIINSDDG